MDLLMVLTALAVAGATFVGVLTVANAMTSTRAAVVARTSAGFAAVQAPALDVSAPPDLDRVGVAFTLERAGLAFTVAEYTAIRVLSGLVFVLLSLLFSSFFGLPLAGGLIVAVIFFLIGTFVPTRWVARRIEKRLNLVEDQLSDGLISMAKSLRAGVGMTQALEYGGRETGDPLGPELLRAVRELQLGADVEVVFEEMNRRIGSRDLEIATTAIIIQRRVGGNLSEILTNVANTIRERKAIRNELNALTAKQRLQGNLSALLPPFVGVLFFLINPDMADALFTTTAGRIALAVGIFFELLGLWMVGRFAKIDV